MNPTIATRPFDSPAKAELYYGIDAVDGLRLLPDKSVQVVATSPPYWEMRNYQVDGQLGAETTLENYVSRLVMVSREIRRVLRDDGTFWLNLGDKRLPKSGIAGVPWRVGEALRADGWIFCQMLIWQKPNALPDPAAKRLGCDHEYILLLSKTNDYFFDAQALRTKVSNPGKPRPTGKSPKNLTKRGDGEGKITTPSSMKYMRTVWSIPLVPSSKEFPHYAAWPPAVARNMIRAGSSDKGCCPSCQAPWQRGATNKVENNVKIPVFTWTQGCDCAPADPVPCMVLDPFSGSAVTGLVALDLKRNYIGIDLNASYLTMAVARITGDTSIMAQPSTEDDICSEFV